MRSRRELEGWRSVHGRRADGTIESDECVRVVRAVVAASPAGAEQLGRRYWLEVASASRGIVRPRRTPSGIELRLLGRGPALLRLAPPETTVANGLVRCRYRILGGLLARAPGGQLTLSQHRGQELRAEVSGFVPRLSSRLYDQLQRRVHVAISRRYFRALIRESGR